ncbi:DNA-directed RNA polymerase subunit [Melia azedarach]|uniref:DNA-directed RNA polymerase subunit n=1 Tax=Melia azedarach TaxID=155640 RepID=A0ACC1WUW4_MELAZ|nr:DNA-directed RNA polymerase subunit [Melia azedarach]
MAAPMLLRGTPHLRLRFAARFLAPPRFTFCSASASEPSQPEEKLSSADKITATLLTVKEPPKYHRWDDPDYRKWKDKEEEILRDIEPILFLTKEILHSDRYMDGERLTAEDERAVVERLLAYHPHSEDKIGCGLDSIMVDRHPQFRHSRCLFVVRTDGGWIDFSYQKCLRAYIRDKYPSHAERFIKEHFKRGSG